jgi:gamma-glutamyltranspeptidase/glutathione hydrolase
MNSRGVVAAGHPLTAEAGAAVLREGGNAIDAAVAAVLTSFVTESPLTGLGAGGFMLVHDADRTQLLDFFVAAPGHDGIERGTELHPAPVYFTEEVPQIFNVGAASCGVPGTPAGLEEALRRFGSMPLAELVRPAVRAARDGVVINRLQAYLFKILEPILLFEAEGRAVYAPEGRPLREGEVFRFPELADALERYGAEGPAPFYTGELGRRISGWVQGRGGTIGTGDLAAYEVAVREPVRARFRGRDVLTNAPPSPGGVLIAFALELFERLGRSDLETTVAVMAQAQAARGEAFARELSEEGFAERFLDPATLDAAAAAAAERRGLTAAEQPGDALGSTTHIAAVDREGRCASVTCSNGTGSGILVPGTGVHLNNMLGEEDLNPLGFHRIAPGERLPSMMSPTVILRDGEFEAGLGSAGSNRIRSAIVQTVLRLVDDGLDAQAAVDAPRVHFERGVLHAEPGVGVAALERVAELGVEVERWRERNLFFGGVQAIARRPDGALVGGGDPRRGGAVAVA